MVSPLVFLNQRLSISFAVNAGALGAVGYFSWKNWDRPSWDRRVVSVVTVGLLTLWSGEGYVVLYG